MLTQVSGVGAKVAVAILSTLTADQVAFSILAGDSKSLTAAPGVGPSWPSVSCWSSKTSLAKDRRVLSREPFGLYPATVGTGNRGEAIAALAALGYSQAEAAAALADCAEDLSVRI